MKVRIVKASSFLPDELPSAALRLEVLEDFRRGLLNLLLRALPVRRPRERRESRCPDVLDLHRDAVLLHRLQEGLLDVDGSVRARVRDLEIAVDRDRGRDDVLLRDLDERLDPRIREPLRRESIFIHHGLLERAIQGAELVEEAIAEPVPPLVNRDPEPLRADREELLRLLLVLPLLDLLPLLVLVHGLQGEIDVALVPVHAEYLADEFLTLADVVPNVLDPAARDLRDVDEALLALVLVERDEAAEVLHLLHRANDELPEKPRARAGDHRFWTSTSSNFFARNDGR